MTQYFNAYLIVDIEPPIVKVETQGNITNIHHNTSLTNKHHLSAYAHKKLSSSNGVHQSPAFIKLFQPAGHTPAQSTKPLCWNQTQDLRLSISSVDHLVRGYDLVAL